MLKKSVPTGLPNFSFLLILTALVQLLAGAVPSSSFAEQIRLAWDDSADPKIAGYRIYYSRVSGQYDRKQMVDVGRTTRHVMQLDPGQWYFVVTAYDSQGNESKYSAEISSQKNGTSEKAGEDQSGQKTLDEMPGKGKLSPSRGSAGQGLIEQSQNKRAPAKPGGRISPSFEPKNLR
jgi:hypothetical protein